MYHMVKKKIVKVYIFPVMGWDLHGSAEMKDTIHCPNYSLIMYAFNDTDFRINNLSFFNHREHRVSQRTQRIYETY